MLVVKTGIEVLRQKSKGFGETMAELAVSRGNFVRRALFQLSPLGAIIIM